MTPRYYGRIQELMGMVHNEDVFPRLSWFLSHPGPYDTAWNQCPNAEDMLAIACLSATIASTPKVPLVRIAHAVSSRTVDRATDPETRAAASNILDATLRWADHGNHHLRDVRAALDTPPPSATTNRWSDDRCVLRAAANTARAATATRPYHIALYALNAVTSAADAVCPEHRTPRLKFLSDAADVVRQHIPVPPPLYRPPKKRTCPSTDDS